MHMQRRVCHASRIENHADTDVTGYIVEAQRVILVHTATGIMVTWLHMPFRTDDDILL